MNESTPIDCPVIVPLRRGWYDDEKPCFSCGAWTTGILRFRIDQEEERVHLCPRHTILEAVRDYYRVLAVLRR